MTFLKAIPCVLWGIIKGALIGAVCGIAGGLLGAAFFFVLSFVGLAMYGWITGPRYIPIEQPWKIFTLVSCAVCAVLGFVWGMQSGFRNMADRVLL